jgi:hypothetical protein
VCIDELRLVGAELTDGFHVRDMVITDDPSTRRMRLKSLIWLIFPTFPSGLSLTMADGMRPSAPSKPMEDRDGEIEGTGEAEAGIRGQPIQARGGDLIAR